MNADPVVALVLSPRDWATRVHRHAVDHGGVRVKARIMSAEDALSSAFEVLVLDDTTSFLSRRLVDELHRAGRKVLGVFDQAESLEGRERLLKIGADAVIGSHQTSEEFVHVIGAMRPEVVPTPVAEGGERHTVSGKIIVVGGPFGGTGSTELAIGLARKFATGGAKTVLIDADDVAPSVAQRLELPLVPNLRTVVDQSRQSEDLTIDESLGFGVVCGIPNPRDWSELREADVSGAVADVAKGAGCVVVDVSSGVERLPGDGRYRLARRLIGMADIVVGVGAPTPLGVSRLLDWVAEVKVLGESARLLLVVNRAPKGAFVRSEVAREIERVFAPSALSFLPMDRRVTRAAWAGDLVRRGAFDRGLAVLAANMLDGDAR